MHGEGETSGAPRTVWVVAHLAFLAVGTWLALGGGVTTLGAWVGADWHAGAWGRRALLFLCGAVMWARMTTTAYYLLKRKFGWDEAAAVSSAVAVYQVGFAALGAGRQAPLGWLDVLGVVLFALGSYLNTGGELQRKRFKDDPRNAGRLYTEGLFGLSRHINYFGDAVWLSGWAIVTHNPWAALLPIAASAGFLFGFIPNLDRYLAQRYGAQYEAWAQRTKRFIPFVY